MFREKKNQKHKVDQYTIQGEFVKRWDSATDAAIYFKTSQGNISNAARGDRKSAQGFVWKYVLQVTDPDEKWLIHPVLGINVSNKGRVQVSKNTVTEGHGSREGYRRVKVQTLQGRKTFSVHRLVAETFKPEDKQHIEALCGDKAQVNHIDKNPSNNKLENLEWCTPSQNMFHRFK
jgi:hypothetical protein